MDNHAKAQCSTGKECVSCEYFGFAGLKSEVIVVIEDLRSIMFPEVFEESDCTASSVISRRADALVHLAALFSRMKVENPKETAEKVLLSLEQVKSVLLTDIQAAYEGDPAATSPEEVMLAYPAFEAISIFRLAHLLWDMKIPMIPRMMCEYAHRITGIDIHPGATIGPYFFIDHGTGVVVGETTVIGSHVKLYQGVTLGAKSFPLGSDGKPIKGIKRHPEIGDNVIIYSGATILGGDTVIGENSVIGGNVWLTHSVEPNSVIIAGK